ncbi:MAG TPA: hypothetical protein VFR58_12040 [Flavisolibacter sp.]|nr:hypothetical protein [Flavisolibacter sp.]
MTKERRPDGKRGAVGFAFAIMIGLVIGIFIKRVHFGLIIGLVLGLLSSSLLRRR